MNGSVVATIDIPTAGNATGPTSFQSFDEYGVPETTTITNSTIQNFGWAGTANRQTKATGLILMGARVYNPVTGQFTSPDPIPGGNETTYTYPNDPINQNDYTGCMPWDSLESGAAFFGGILLPAVAGVIFCASTFGVGCIIALAVAGAVAGGYSGYVAGKENGLRGGYLTTVVAGGALLGAATSVAGGAVGSLTTTQLRYQGFGTVSTWIKIQGAKLPNSSLPNLAGKVGLMNYLKNKSEKAKQSANHVNSQKYKRKGGPGHFFQ
jgi:RHS repeat-associated protein